MVKPQTSRPPPHSRGACLEDRRWLACPAGGHLGVHTYTTMDPPTQPAWDDSQSAGEMPAQQAPVHGIAVGMGGDLPVRQLDAAYAAGRRERQASDAIGHAKGTRATVAKDQLQTGGRAAEGSNAAEPAQQCSGGSDASAGSAQARQQQRQPSAAQEPPHSKGPAAGPSAGTAQQAALAEPADPPERAEPEPSGHNSKGKRSSQSENHPSQQQQQCHSQRQRGQEQSQGQQAVQSGEPVHRLQTAAQAGPHPMDLPASQHSTSQPPARLTPAGAAAADTCAARSPRQADQAAAVLPHAVGGATGAGAAHEDLQAGQAAALLPGAVGGAVGASRPCCEAQGAGTAAETQEDCGQGAVQSTGVRTAAGPPVEVAQQSKGVAVAQEPRESLGRGSSQPAPRKAGLAASQRHSSGAAPAVLLWAPAHPVRATCQSQHDCHQHLHAQSWLS